MTASKIVLLSLALSACAGEAPGNAASAEANATAPAAQGEVEATLDRFEAGDHLWAVFRPIPGREAESTALVEGGAPLAAFLDAHKREPLHVRIETVRRHLDPPGEVMDVTQVTAARAGTLTHEAWWQSLTPVQRTAAEERVADLMSAPAEE